MKCSDGSYYVGHTDDLESRLAQHHHKAFPACYTATRLPVKCVFTQAFPEREDALRSERQIKGWSRVKKEALIMGDWVALSAHAKRRKKNNN